MALRRNVKSCSIAVVGLPYHRSGMDMLCFFFSSRRRHTRCSRDWSSDVCSSDLFERVRPILESLGSLTHVGGPGAGAAMKLVANLVLGASIAAVGEAVALGEALGLGRAPLLNMLEDSQLAPAVRAKRANIESGHYPPNFKLRHAAQDLRLVVEAIDRDLKVTAAARTWLDAAVERGAADQDYSAGGATIVGEEPKA